MELVAHENQEIYNCKIELYKYKKLKTDLLENLDRIDAAYRHHFPQEIARIFDLEVEIRKLQAAEMAAREKNQPPSDPNFDTKETPEQKKEKKKTNKLIKEMYRLISNLCHPDKVGQKKDLSEEDKEVLHDMFLSGKDAYNMKDISSLRFVYDQILSFFNKSKSFNAEEFNTKYKNTIKDKSDDEILKELKTQLNSVLSELKQLELNPMFAVLKFDTEKNMEGAKNVYRQLLNANIQRMNSEIAFLRQRLFTSSTATTYQDESGQTFIKWY